MQTKIDLATQHFEKYFQQETPPGCGWALVYNGEIIYEKFLGVAEVDHSEPLTRENIFRIASLTKSFTASAIIKLRALGLLDLDTQASHFLPIHSRVSDILKKLTIRELLTMTGRLPTDDPSADRFLGYSDEQYDAIVSIDPLLVHTNALLHNYSNLAYILLGKIISHTSGKSALNFITEEILNPLGLHKTQWSGINLSSSIYGYHRYNSKWKKVDPIHTRGDGDTFAGLWSNFDDLSRWIGYLGRKIENKREVLSISERIEMCASHYRLAKYDLKDPIKEDTYTQFDFYGYGIWTYIIDGELYHGHSGGLPGYSSHMRWHAESGFGILAFSNATCSPVWNPCALALHAIVSDIRNQVATPPTSITDAAKKLLTLIKSTDMSDLHAVFSNNVFLDKSIEEISSDISCLRNNLGAQIELCAITMSAGLQAKISLLGESKKYEITFSLSPYDDAKIQQYSYVMCT